MTLFERRIGQRKTFTGFPAVLVPLRRRGSSGKARPARKSGAHCQVLDMSLSGANIAAPSNLELTVGMLIEVRIDEDRSFVGRLKRLTPTDDEELVCCGVAYQEMTPGCREWLNEWTASESG